VRRITLPERPNWRETAKTEGFHFAHLDGENYWDETGCFAFTLEEVERDIEGPSAELHAMCLDLVARAVGDETILAKLGVPEPFFDLVSQSWRAIDPTVMGRFDLAYTGSGPAKLLEYNADTPTSLYEAAVFQWKWMEEASGTGIVPAGSDQFNSIHDHLIAAYRNVPKDSLLHFTCRADNVEDFGTTAYMIDCALQAGHRPKFTDLSQIGRDQEGRFTDQDNLVIDVLAKLEPWEWLFRDEYGALIPKSGTLFIEPAWKAALSTKAILPLLWETHEGHPNLLPAFFEGDPRGTALGQFVRKPIFSREGANATLVKEGETLAETGGLYGEGAHVIQEAAALFRSPSGYAVLGSWIINGQPAGIGIREDRESITTNMSRFVPHIIDGTGWTGNA
jgi:glutathionylspermidine synthase